MSRLRLASALVGLVFALGCLQGGTAAAATVFCKENVETCPKESVYALGTSYTASSKTLYTRISTTFPWRVIDCEGATLKWKTTETTGLGVLKGSVESLTFGACSEQEEACSPAVEAQKLPWKAEFERKSGENYATIPSVLRVSCGFGGACTYPVGTFHGRLPVLKEGTHLWVENRLGSPEGPLTCPKEITWQLDLPLESPKPAFLTLG
jgi:hypothetical protein